MRRRLRASQRLVHDLPQLFTAMARGELREEAALAIGRSTGPLTPEQRGLIDEHLNAKRPYLDGASSGEWAREVDRLAHQLDPAGRRGRAVRAARERTVTVTRAPHGMAHLHAHLPAIEGMAIRKALSLHAERLRADGDRRGNGPIMADRLADLLLGRDEAWDPISLDLGVVITERSLIEPEHGEPAILEGYGAVPPAQVPEWLREHPDAMMRRLFTHPTSGELVALDSRARTVPDGLARLVAWRDQRCRAPFCDAPIRQLDHITARAAGGETSLENLQGLCQHCNLVEESARHVAATRIDGRHTVHWRSRGGRTVHCTAPTLVDPPPPAVIPSCSSPSRGRGRARGRPPRAPLHSDQLDLPLEVHAAQPGRARSGTARARDVGPTPARDAGTSARDARPPRSPHQGGRRRTGRERVSEPPDGPE